MTEIWHFIHRIRLGITRVVFKQHLTRMENVQMVRIFNYCINVSLCGKSPNMEFFSGPNTGKYGIEKTPYWALFKQRLSNISNDHYYQVKI